MARPPSRRRWHPAPRRVGAAIRAARSGWRRSSPSRTRRGWPPSGRRRTPSRPPDPAVLEGSNRRVDERLRRVRLVINGKLKQHLAGRLQDRPAGSQDRRQVLFAIVHPAQIRIDDVHRDPRRQPRPVGMMHREIRQAPLGDQAQHPAGNVDRMSVPEHPTKILGDAAAAAAPLQDRLVAVPWTQRRHLTGVEPARPIEVVQLARSRDPIARGRPILAQSQRARLWANPSCFSKLSSIRPSSRRFDVRCNPRPKQVLLPPSHLIAVSDATKIPT